MKKIKIIISGGGTGGHIFPAVAIADTLKESADCEILFVGADDRMEMTLVPKSGYKIIGLPIKGLVRKLSFKNVATVFKLIKSMGKAKKIIADFKPDVVVGVGGYASAAVCRVAASKRIPVIIQEQNSYPGITNKILSKKATAIFVAYDKMDRFFAKEKIFLSGNPIRNLKKSDVSQGEAQKHFGLKNNKKTILITGGSLGATTLNNSVISNVEKLQNSDVQIIWQTGKRHYANAKKVYDELSNKENIVITEFIDRMDLAYKAADLVISRAGAITISELALLQKAVIFVPSPNVTEDHQTKNAQALVEIDAAIMVKDAEAENILIKTALETLNDNEKLAILSENIAKYAKPEAAKTIVKKILELTE